MAATIELPPASDSVQLIGVDLGGTKCAISHLVHGRVIERLRVPTGDRASVLPALIEVIRQLRDGRELRVGISCGGPLDLARGSIVNPPNLPHSWHHFPICAARTRSEPMPR